MRSDVELLDGWRAGDNNAGDELVSRHWKSVSRFFRSRRERGELVREGFARIPLDDQIALELAYLESMSTREIAGVLEIPENTVRSRLSRARDKLRAVLAELGTTEDAALADSQLEPS